MDIQAILQKTRDGEVLSTDEIKSWITGYLQGKITDYQMSAWLMAVYFRGLSARETTDLTLAMAASGKEADWQSTGLVTVDKHSTGGVADTTTLVVASMVAAAGGKVAKMSGRGLGFTGGTLDKLESIPGFRIDLSEQEFIRQVQACGIAVVGQNHDLAPADGLLYALRDVTATVESLPLIASSVMSKKLAGGAAGIVLDVKCGRAAFMKTPEEAFQLADLMVDIGSRSGRNMVAIVSDMNAPLGTAIGNSLEVDEAVAVLSGRGGRRLTELCLLLAGTMLEVGGIAADPEEGRALAEKVWRSGEALDKFAEWIRAQGGGTDWLGKEPLTRADKVQTVTATASGYVTAMDALALADVAAKLGAGRIRKEDRIDLHVGVRIEVELGDWVETGETLATIYGRSQHDLQSYVEKTRQAFVLSSVYQEPPLVYKIIRGKSRKKGK